MAKKIWTCINHINAHANRTNIIMSKAEMRKAPRKLINEEEVAELPPKMRKF